MPRQATAKTGQPQNPEIFPFMQCMKKTGKNKRKFTAEEDLLIIELVGGERYPNWNDIASHIQGKNARQCRERYNHYLAPNVSNDPWTEEEDQILLDKFKEFGTDWAKICTFFKGRTNTAVKNRFNVHLSKKYMVNNINAQTQIPPQQVVQPPQQQTNQTQQQTNQTQQQNSQVDIFSPSDGFTSQHFFGYQPSDDESTLYNFDFNSDDHFISSMGSAEAGHEETFFPYF